MDWQIATNHFDDYMYPQLSWRSPTILIIVTEKKSITAKYINSKPWANNNINIHEGSRILLD